MNYNWNWAIFWQLSPDGKGSYLDTFIAGLGWTLATASLAWMLALLLGATVGCLRTVPDRRLTLVCNAYIEIFRNVPLLVQMFLWYFVAPELLPAALGDGLKALPHASFVTAVLCLGLYTSSRVAVQVSAGIESLPRGQCLAGLALGLSLAQTYRHVLLPMAFRVIIPPLTNECVNVVKNSAVALTIGLLELTASARSMQEFSFQVFEAFTLATVLYLSLNAGVVGLMRWIERRTAVPGTLAAAGRKGGA
jgi:glutamate/aspartate transport system permease protein